LPVFEGGTYIPRRASSVQDDRAASAHVPAHHPALVPTRARSPWSNPDREKVVASYLPRLKSSRREKDAVAAKTRQGLVVSNKGEKSITVRIDIARRHPTYEKVVRRSRTLHAHDEQNEAGEGDTVRIVETRPLSKTKRWRLVEVLEKAK